MNRRLGVASILAAAITIGLFFVMQQLISRGGEGRLREVRSQAIEFVRLKAENELDTKRRLPSRQELMKPPPPPPPIQNARVPKPRGEQLAVGGPSLNMGLKLAGPELGAVVADTAPIPLVRVDPVYPPRAQSRGTEGWVVVEFTITAAGTVTDAVVVEAQPPSVFNRAALKAIRRWKYRPKVVGGTPVDQPGQQTMISFKIAGGR